MVHHRYSASLPSSLLAVRPRGFVDWSAGILSHAGGLLSGEIDAPAKGRGGGILLNPPDALLDVLSADGAGKREVWVVHHVWASIQSRVHVPQPSVKNAVSVSSISTTCSPKAPPSSTPQLSYRDKDVSLAQ